MCKISCSLLETLWRNSNKSRRRSFKDFFRDNVRPEVAGDVVSVVAVERIGLGVGVKFGDSRSKRS